MSAGYISGKNEYNGRLKSSQSSNCECFFSLSIQGELSSVWKVDIGLVCCSLEQEAASILFTIARPCGLEAECPSTSMVPPTCACVISACSHEMAAEQCDDGLVDSMILWPHMSRDIISGGMSGTSHREVIQLISMKAGDSEDLRYNPSLEMYPISLIFQ